MSLCVVAAGLAGCASDNPQWTQIPSQPVRGAVLDNHQKPQQCVPYAREHSDVKIYGDAWTWWDQAVGRYAESALPQTGAVMVLTNYAGPERGHVAVVRQLISSREIRVDHANWLDDGAIYLNDPVQDVSPDNDWTQVRVYNIKTGGWGSRIYPVQGFIGGPDPDGGAPDLSNPPDQQRPDLVARAEFHK
jgi:hypothetical protein